MQDYQFKTTPYQHQSNAFALCRDKEFYALFMEQGTGKTKVALDKACYQYCNGKINAVLIVAPNGVHSNWIKTELAKHIPDYIQYATLLWKTGAQLIENNKRKVQIEDYLLKNQDKLLFFAVNIEALSTENGKKIVRKYIDYKNVLFILDESSRIKTPSAQRTKAVINFGKLAKERLILTGTPVTQSPFDIYTQFKFLDPHILGNQTYTAFKHEYGVFEKKVNFKTGYPYDHLLQYKNLDQLQQLIKPYSYRITKDECLDLPEKIYQRYQVELTPVQRQHYEELKQNLITEIQGKDIVAPIVLTKLLRLQQIVGGFITFTDEKETLKLDGDNPKLKLMLDLLEDIHGKVIIWARFKAEIKMIVAALRETYGYQSATEYWGEISQENRLKAIDDFQNKDNTRFFVGNAKAGGIGLTLTAANTMIYFSNDFSLETRLQSEDRAHRIGQKDHVIYIDIEATDTLDCEIIDALRNKKNVADLITGDKLKDWL